MPIPNRSPSTAPYYVYHLTFHSDIPDALNARHALNGFPRSARDIWVWKRSSRNLLLTIEPGARWVKHEARKCSRCGRWCLGIQAQMMRDREEVARMNQTPLPPCGDGCTPRSALLRQLKEMVNAR